MRRTSLTAAAILFASFAGAQTATLTTDAINAAIQVGEKQKNRDHGLTLHDTLSALGAIADNPSSTGFSVVVYTPTTWVRHNAAVRAKKYQHLLLEDVDEDMREPILRVIANPDVPRQVTAKGARGSSSVDHVVLQDKTKEITIQPISMEPFTDDVKNALGASLTYAGMRANFKLEDLKELRGPNGDREFYVLVIGSTGEEKRFEVKKKHFDDLP
jgi:hypothetical protein